MPGIFGSIDRSGNPISEKTAIEMATPLKHENTYVSSRIFDSCLLGTVERGTGGHNILDDAETMLMGVSRGHVLNKNELSERLGVEPQSQFLSDVRFIMQLYKKLDHDFAKYINGLFSIGLYDKERKRLLVANDRYGFYPMFYCLRDGRFVFASEIKPLLKEPMIIPSINREAIPEFFSFNQLIGDRTFFEQVKWLRPASILIYDMLKDQVLTRQYWDFSVDRGKEHKVADLDILLKSFKKLMMKAVERAVQDRKEVGVFLSGGLDSRIVAAFASETDVDIVTFTYGAKNCPQQEIARRVAEELGLRNLFYTIPSDFIADFATEIVYHGDGLVRIRDCHSIAFLKRISNIVDTVLLGTMGESLFGWNIDPLFRYIRRTGDFNWKSLESVKTYIFNREMRGLALDIYPQAFAEDFHVQAKQMLMTNFNKEFNQVVRNNRFNTAIDLLNYWDYRVREQRYIFQAFQFMNWYLETRHPFLDNDLVDYFAFRLPVQLQIGERFLMKALNYCFPILGKIPLETGSRPDADEIRVLMGQMKGFAHRKAREVLEFVSRGKISIRPPDYRDYAKWLRSGSRDYALDVLLSSETLNRGFFRREFIERIVHEHMTAKKDHDAIICDLINFELMNRMFFNSEKKERSIKSLQDVRLDDRR